MEPAAGRVAFAYDRTRYHPPEVSGRIATAITAPVEARFKEPHFLELGVGTGRIGVPVLARGFRFTAVDTDPAMLQVFRYKIAGVARKVRLIEADARALPFERASFHGVISVHLWHLLDDWQRSLLEALRVLAPGGYLFEGWDESVGESEDCRIQKTWAEILRRQGFELVRGRHRERLLTVERALKGLGLVPRTELVAEWTEERTPRQSLEAIAERLYSYTLQVPDDHFFPSVKALLAWAAETYDDLDRPYPIRWRFFLRVTER